MTIYIYIYIYINDSLEKVKEKENLNESHYKSLINELMGKINKKDSKAQLKILKIKKNLSIYVI